MAEPATTFSYINCVYREGDGIYPHYENTRKIVKVATFLAIDRDDGYHDIEFTTAVTEDAAIRAVEAYLAQPSLTNPFASRGDELKDKFLVNAKHEKIGIMILVTSKYRCLCRK
ncbi:MAG: hypothetical protein ACMG6E_02220 [Candidatus Roizmanbacteria bacterium]